MPRVLLLGSPPFAEPIRERLAALGWLCGVLTVPPRPRGRGRRLSPPPGWVPDGRTVFAPPRPTPDAVAAVVAAVRPDSVVLASYGQILPPPTLAVLPRHRLNVHPSLLPRWRGAAPIPRTILAGDAVTGVTLHELAPAVDAGGILAVERHPLDGSETSGTLGPVLAGLGADLVARVLPRYLAGTLVPTPQPEEGATLAPKLLPEEAVLVPWERSAVELERAVRAFDPWPGARITLGSEPLLVRAARVDPSVTGEPGTVVRVGSEPTLTTTEGGLVLTRVQRPGRATVDGTAFLRGFRATLPLRLARPAGTSASR